MRSNKVKKTNTVSSNAKLFRVHFASARYELALQVLENLIAKGVTGATIFADASVTCVHLERWEDAIKYGRRAIKQGSTSFAVFDALSHAYGALQAWDDVEECGRRALDQRAHSVAKLSRGDKPLLTSERASKNVIAFSLFGGSSKYCETAILNCVEQPLVYPGWECWFYVDQSVPMSVRQRLIDAGAKLLEVEADTVWPGPMWRFRAYDDPDVARVIFRDADSVISRREASAVAAWQDSGHGFHIMRDSGSHTELMLAGLWGVKKGALPSMNVLVQEFLKMAVEDSHFADQYFLRQFVWPYARESALQHDSVFGWNGAHPFPDGARPNDFHVGYAEGSPFISLSSKLEEGTPVTWYLVDVLSQPEREICRYPATVTKSGVKAHVPARYAKRIQSGEIRVGLDRA